MTEGVKQLPSGNSARASIRNEFLINRQGKQYVLIGGLLDAAHRNGLNSIDTELIQVPTEENGRVAIVKARVYMPFERTFSGIGDASPENVSRNIAPHIIRMAETRAKARALRDAVNAGAVLLEDEPDEAEPVQHEKRHSYSPEHTNLVTEIQKVLYRIPADIRREKGLTDEVVFAQADKGEAYAFRVLEKVRGYAAEAGVLPRAGAEEEPAQEEEEEEESNDVMPEDLFRLVKVLDGFYGEKDAMSGSEWYEENVLGHPLTDLSSDEAKKLIDELTEKGAQEA